MKTKIYKTASVLLILFNSLGALGGGGSLIMDPSGKGIQLSDHWLKDTPFNDYLIPGLILFLCNGLFGLAVLTLIFRNASKYPLFVILQGLILCGWILIQMMLLQTANFLHILYLIIGGALIILGFLQKNSKRYNR
jgi:hypothetical protein